MRDRKELVERLLDLQKQAMTKLKIVLWMMCAVLAILIIAIY